MARRGWSLVAFLLLFVPVISGCLGGDDKDVAPEAVTDTEGDTAAGDNETVEAPEAPEPAPAPDPVAPVAAFSVNLTAPVAGEEILFDANATTDADTAIEQLTFAWEFGDGSTAEGINTTHAFASEGTYNVTLNVTDPSGLSNATTLPVVVASGFVGGIFATLTGTIAAPNPAIAALPLYESLIQPAQAPDTACTSDLECAKKLGTADTHYKLFDIVVPPGTGYVRFRLNHEANTAPLGIHVFRADTGDRYLSSTTLGQAESNADGALTPVAPAFQHLTWTIMVWIPAGASKAFEVSAEAFAAKPA